MKRFQHRPELHRSSDVPPDLFAANIRAPRANIIRVYKRTFMAAAAIRLKPATKAGEVKILSRRHLSPAGAAAFAPDSLQSVI